MIDPDKSSLLCRKRGDQIQSSAAVVCLECLRTAAKSGDIIHTDECSENCNGIVFSF